MCTDFASVYPCRCSLHTPAPISSVAMANAYEVESMEISASDEDLYNLYNEACEADSVVASSLSIPTDRRYATLVVEGLGSEVIGKVEKLSAVTVGSNTVELKRHYHVSGECPLLVETGEGKLGAWVFKLGK
ncbi:hypothetical protein N7468_000765 [Penicillium chermesinum]|uniref:Uncharacterized protein n=1 Tax=Penicillium chermesinum TaxID=63820 RepID=A0A9W9PM82_9EURO|nr:uncharacterized protein N7468_000765 [Penicillium chermesinum]KAJ5249314.1 hypothetical protein N7468_000765 [Penicillium chermesinum]